MNDDLTLEAFVLALEQYGGDPDRWPPSLRAATTTLLATSPAAAEALDRARALDRLLHDNDPAADIDPASYRAVRQRVLVAIAERAAHARAARGAWWRVFLPSAPVRLPAVRFAATALTAAVLGILAGQGISQFGSVSTESVSSYETQSGLAAMFRQPLAITVAQQ